ncbi:hypothetical protein TWF730_009761 [Orbilia blumenaviensis]|uniref:Uncharacterized protein n=1 Tax=Orbilia blumenaviensis TaxID=1796055 RepID=A0AAV9UVW1_9PEZI
MVQADVLIILDSCKSGLAVVPSNLPEVLSQGIPDDKSRHGKEIIVVDWARDTETGTKSIAIALAQSLKDIAINGIGGGRKRRSFSGATLAKVINMNLWRTHTRTQNPDPLEKPIQVHCHQLQRHSEGKLITFPVLRNEPNPNRANEEQYVNPTS